MDARLIRCLLFVPGDRPDRFEKAERAGADGVVFDLEDAVAPPSKAAAATHVLKHLAAPGAGGVARIVRLNRLGTADGERDLAALAAAGAPLPDLVMLPKVEDAAAVQLAARHFAGKALQPRIIALIESARGLENAPAIAQASPQLAALGFGGADLAADLGAAFAWEPLLYGRSRVVAAAALSGVAVLDVPFLNIKDSDGLAREAAAVRRLGFTGKMAIHPAQVAAIIASFSPSAEEIERARRIMTASQAAQGGVATVDGRMIDAPVVAAAQHILALAARGAAR